MSTAKTGVWGPLGTVVIVFALLLSSARSPAQSRDMCLERPRFVKERNIFEPKLKDGVWSLHYRFRDSLDQERKIECRIGDKEYQQQKDDLGLHSCIGNLQGHAACLEETTMQIRPLASRTLDESYLRRRGFQKVEGKYLLDYAGLATKAAGALGHCAEELSKEIGTNKNDWLAFFQAMRPDEDYKKLRVDRWEPVDGRNKYIAGLLVPTEVMIRNLGDCDSKALAFRALQRDPAEKWVIFSSKSLDCDRDGEGHAFLAFENGATPYRRKIDLPKVLAKGWPINERTFEGNVLHLGTLMTYTVMDVTGPGITTVGELDPLKYGNYIGFPMGPDPPQAPVRRGRAGKPG